MLNQPLRLFLRYCLVEFANPRIMFSAFIIGASINWFGTGDPFATPMGFVIPFLVQAISRALVQVKNRFQSVLALLPMQRRDPAFVMGPQGEIILAMGKTQRYFEDHGVQSLYQYLGAQSRDQVQTYLQDSTPEQAPLELYSAMSHRWYSIEMIKLEGAKAILVWMDDISPVKRLHERILSISSYSEQVLGQLEQFTSQADIYRRMAPFILGMGFQAAFIALRNKSGQWVGQASRYREGQLVYSQEIVLAPDSLAPILLSRRQGHLIEAQREEGTTQAEFEQVYPFHRDIKNFIGEPISRFMNYHEGPASIIAFNQQGSQHRDDGLFLHTLMNSSRMLFYLVDLAVKNEEQFLQKVMGLCAAAEFSDETTGKHILRVNRLSALIAEEMKLPPKFVRSISQVAALHDIGKVAMPDLIKFNGKYSAEQRTEMMRHTLFGAQIIRTMMDFSSSGDEKLAMAYEIALHHHQSFDGGGYPSLPQGPEAGTSPLAGDAIPLAALIVGLADSYDALRSARQYKPGFSHEEAFSLLALDDRSAKTGLDRFGPRVWEAANRVAPQMEQIFNELS
ncbi:MAG: HD domain-containing protein [bacterium]|nr:HD domain-containing protein [bacterium]